MTMNKKNVSVKTYLFAGDKIFCCIGVNSFDRLLSTFASFERPEPRTSPKPVNVDRMFMSVNLDDGVCAGLELCNMVRLNEHT